MKKFVVAAIVAALLACGRPEVTRNDWTKMDAKEKTLVVRAIEGHQEAVYRKGGQKVEYHASVDEYIRKIDEQYARGDQRNVSAIWRDLAKAEAAK